jgi:hypothetical protein
VSVIHKKGLHKVGLERPPLDIPKAIALLDELRTTLIKLGYNVEHKASDTYLWLVLYEKDDKAPVSRVYAHSRALQVERCTGEGDPGPFIDRAGEVIFDQIDDPEAVDDYGWIPVAQVENGRLPFEECLDILVDLLTRGAQKRASWRAR